MFSNFGERDPRMMPTHFFMGHLRLDYDSAIKADTSRQNYTVAPRHWYVDATFRCDRCRGEFQFTAAEQKAWYEGLAFYVDSRAEACRACRRELRRLKSLRQEYDREIAHVLAGKEVAAKVHLASVVDRLLEAGEDLPAKVLEHRELLAKQISRLGGPKIA